LSSSATPSPPAKFFAAKDDAFFVPKAAGLAAGGGGAVMLTASSMPIGMTDAPVMRALLLSQSPAESRRNEGEQSWSSGAAAHLVLGGREMGSIESKCKRLIAAHVRAALCARGRAVVLLAFAHPRCRHTAMSPPMDLPKSRPSFAEFERRPRCRASERSADGTVGGAALPSRQRFAGKAD
jgi:hypothetical protein